MGWACIKDGETTRNAYWWRIFENIHLEEPEEAEEQYLDVSDRNILWECGMEGIGSGSGSMVALALEEMSLQFLLPNP